MLPRSRVRLIVTRGEERMDPRGVVTAIIPNKLVPDRTDQTHQRLE